MKKQIIFDYDSKDGRKEMPKMRREYFKKHDKKCSRCGSKKGIHLHHLKPVSEGGLTTEENLSPLCSTCHREYHLFYDKDKFSYQSFLEKPNIDELVVLWELLNQEANKDITVSEFIESYNGVRNPLRELRGYADYREEGSV